MTNFWFTQEDIENPPEERNYLACQECGVEHEGDCGEGEEA